MTERHPHTFMADEFDKLVFSKASWLADLSQGQKKRPDHEIEIKRRELSVLRQAAEDYRQAAERKTG